LARRKYKAEGSFANASNNYGYKRARWRGLPKMRMQNLMIAAIQNLGKLLRHTSGKFKKVVIATSSIWRSFSWAGYQLLLTLATNE
jgi:hypothetical protein